MGYPLGASRRQAHHRWPTLVVATAVAGLCAGRVRPTPRQAAAAVSFTILHTNDFHGKLEPSGSNPGAARVAQKIADVRTAVGAANVLLFDAGDEMQGSLLSNLQQGAPVIDYSTPSATTPPPSATTSSTGARRSSTTASRRPSYRLTCADADDHR